MKSKVLWGSVFCLFAAAANAATIDWGTPTTISGPSDVSTLGTYFGSWAPYNFPAYDAGGLTVNGVDFQASSDLPDQTYNASGGYGGYVAPSTSDANYNTLLTSGGDIAGQPLVVSWDGMTVGDTYLVQFWVNDGRSYGAGRTETLTGGSNTSAPLTFGSDTTGPGQFIIGEFVADAPSETISVNGNQDSLMNLLQVRDITAVPEPTSLALLGIGAGTVILGCRRQKKAA